MKPLFHFVLLICLSMIAVAPSTAQITITATDVNAYLTPGNTITTKIDTGTHTVNIGALGATSWDFSGLTTAYSATSVPVNPDTTSTFSLFPDATHALKSSGYTYFKLATNLESLGFAESAPFSIQIKYMPPPILDQLPMTIGTSWTSAYVESSYTVISGITYASGKNQSVTNTVDAYGSLTLPGGSVHQALRLKSDRHTTSGSSTTRLISYQFLAKDGAAVSVVPTDTSQPQTGSISISSVSWNLSGPATSVDLIPGSTLPSNFALEQNYPNPFNPSTTIRFSVAENSFVSLKVYNLLGQELSTLVSQHFAPGRYSVQWDASGLPSGFYVYRMQSGTFAETKRLVLLR